MAKIHKKIFLRKVLGRYEILKCRNKRRLKRRKTRIESSKKYHDLPMETPVEQTIAVEEDLKPTRKRFYRCCVPHCPTYGPSDLFVSFPSSDSALRRVWLDSIPRKNWFVCHNTLICNYHFKRNSNNEKLENHIPTLFPQPTPLKVENKYGRIDKAMFQISSNYALPETFGELALDPNCDKFIFDFCTLTSKYKEQLKMVLEDCKWMTQESSDQLVFYKVYSVDGYVKVSMSIVIDTQLKPTIALDGIIMDPLDCTRHISVNGRITHWNQLNLMLLDYGSDRQEEKKNLSVINLNITNLV